MNWLGRLFRGGPKQPSTIVDPDFGKISFEPTSDDGSVGFWQMHDGWDLGGAFAEVGCNSIPGTSVGPAAEARAFLLAKRDSIQEAWNVCAEALQRVRSEWRNLPQEGPLEECFKLTALGMEEPITSPPQWSVAFESVGRFWIFIEFQLEENRVLGYHCDT